MGRDEFEMDDDFKPDRSFTSPILLHHTSTSSSWYRIKMKIIDLSYRYSIINISRRAMGTVSHSIENVERNISIFVKKKNIILAVL